MSDAHRAPFWFAAVILAAGSSRRMGRPKLLLPWGGTSVVGHLISQWQSLGARQIAVVCAAGDPVIQAELDRLGHAPEQRISNPEPELGMFSSVQCAARWPRWLPDVTHWVMILGDQPHLRRETLQAVLESATHHPDSICLPRQGGHRRHPLVLPRSAFRGIADFTGPDLKAFLNSRPDQIITCATDDPGLELDLNRPEDYERAIREYLSVRSP